MIDGKKNRLLGGAAVALMVAGGAVAISSARAAGPVNLPAQSALSGVLPGAPQSFADIFQKVSPAVVSIDITGRASPTEAAMMGGQEDEDGPGAGQGGQGGGMQGLPFPFQIGRAHV